MLLLWRRSTSQCIIRASVFTGDRKISWNEFTFSLASGFKLLQPICICRTEFVRNFTA